MTWRRVIIHHSAGSDDEGPQTQAYRRYHVGVRGWRDLGYHFVCELVGAGYEVLAGRPLNMGGAHTRGHNSDAIGFCFAGNFELEDPDPEQLAVGARFLAGLMDCLEIPSAEIYPHNDFRPTDCPGKNLNIAELIQLVDRYRIS